jgi:hypothetical protein
MAKSDPLGKGAKACDLALEAMQLIDAEKAAARKGN